MNSEQKRTTEIQQQGVCVCVFVHAGGKMPTHPPAREPLDIGATHTRHYFAGETFVTHAGGSASNCRLLAVDPTALVQDRVDCGFISKQKQRPTISQRKYLKHNAQHAAVVYARAACGQILYEATQVGLKQRQSPVPPAGLNPPHTVLTPTGTDTTRPHQQTLLLCCSPLALNGS